MNLRYTHPKTLLTFVWTEGSDIIEVFRHDDEPEVPFEAVSAEGLNFNDSALKRLANADYAIF